MIESARGLLEELLEEDLREKTLLQRVIFKLQLAYDSIVVWVTSKLIICKLKMK